MRKTLIWVLLILMFSTAVFANAYKKINNQGEANIIFASTAIEKGQEAKAKLKDTFTSDEKIFGRAYFPKAIGKFSNGEEMYQNLWIDGKFAVKGPLVDMDSTWDQMQIWLYKTGEDDFKMMVQALNNLPKGKHEVAIYLMRTKFTGTKWVINDNGESEKKNQYSAVNLSAGKFTFIKK